MRHGARGHCQFVPVAAILGTPGETYLWGILGASDRDSRLLLPEGAVVSLHGGGTSHVFHLDRHHFLRGCSDIARVRGATVCESSKVHHAGASLVCTSANTIV